MTAPTRTSIIIFDAQVTAGSTTKATAVAASTPAAGNGGWIDISAFNGGDIGWSITNSASAPSTALAFIVQFSSTNNLAKGAYDRWQGAGDVVASSVTSGLVPIPATAKFVRGLGFGNQTNAAGLYLEAMLKA
jgi:hypothetical protein